MLLNELPDDYYSDYITKVNALTPAEISQAAAMIQPDKLTWVIVGDLAKIQQPIEKLGLAEVDVLQLVD